MVSIEGYERLTWAPREERYRGRRAPVREPELSELRAFCAAVHLGSIAEAARFLQVSQPALSKRLRVLETVVGARLLERSSKGVTLTSDGARLYGAALRVLDGADTVSALISDRADAMPVRIAVTPSVADIRLAPALAEFAQREPGIAVELVIANTWFVRDLVACRQVPLGVAALDPYTPPVQGMHERPLWRDEVVIAVPAGHPWERVEEVDADELTVTSVIQLDPWSRVSRIVGTALARLDVQLAVPFASLGTITAALMLAHAVSVPALVPQSAVALWRPDEFAIRRVAGVRFDQELALIWWGSTRELEPHVQAFAKYLLNPPDDASESSGGQPSDGPFTRSRERARAYARTLDEAAADGAEARVTPPPTPPE